MKRATIAITGLPAAGKTSFTQRLITGSYITSQPTFGVDVEFTSYQELPLQIWDMGGHMAFRKHIWRNYVEQSSGLIYIFDASDIELMEESVEWFWECYSWIEEKEVPILFLANKWDLVENKDEVMEKIISGFRLNDIASKALKTPFRFFFISVKTGAYLTEAMNWLVVKHLLNKQKPQTNVLSFDLFLRHDGYMAHIHDNSSTRNQTMEIINVYRKKWRSNPNSILNLFEEINYNDQKVFFASYPNRAIVIITENEHIDKAIVVNIVENIQNLEDTHDINIFYSVFESTKDELLKSFQSEISHTLSCDVVMIETTELIKEETILF